MMSCHQEEIARMIGQGGLQIFSCKKCRFQTASEVNALCHVKLCHSVTPASYRCDECGFKAKDANDLRVHSIFKHSVRKTYQCSECSFSSVDKIALMHHVHSVHFIAGCSSRKLPRK